MTQAQNLDSIGLSRAASVSHSRMASHFLACQIKSQWQDGEPADALAALARFPELRGEKSVILDLAYEEYCLRLEAGEAPDAEEFCKRFPTFKASLRRLIEAHRFLEENSGLLAESAAIGWPEVGEHFLGFNLVRELGRGAFARVFLAREPALGNRKVAVKISPQGSAEAETLGRINHPNIVPIHSVEEDRSSKLTSVCMPYLGGATLCDVLDQIVSEKRLPEKASIIINVVRALPAGEEVTERTLPHAVYSQGTFIDGILHIGAQLADGLACIHALGICHRDLKPSNVLMTPDGRPMLLDFNLCFDEKIADSRLGGTLPYMSPEQLLATDLERGNSLSLIDHRSDIFSLGVILYELLTGVHPYGPVPGNLPSPELRKHLLTRLQSQPQPLSHANPRVDKGLARIIESCLKYNPIDRPQSAAELANALRKALSRVQRMRRWAAAHPRRVAAAVLVGAAVMFSGAYSFAVQEKASTRNYQEGVAAYGRGEFGLAVKLFDRALEKEETSRAYWARARAEQNLGDIRAAEADYARADQLAPEARNKAMLAYCLLLRGDISTANMNSFRAINDGFASAEVFNNLGLACSRVGQFDAALDKLTVACGLNPTLQAAFYNRAVVDLKLASLQPHHVPTQGISDMEKALELGPPATDEFLNLFSLYVKAGQNQRNVDEAARYLLLTSDPLGTAGRLSMGPVAMRPGYLAGALKAMRLALQHGYDPASAMTSYGRMLNILGPNRLLRTCEIWPLTPDPLVNAARLAILPQAEDRSWMDPVNALVEEELQLRSYHLSTAKATFTRISQLADPVVGLGN
jgi:serine/threonine protein kinase/Tfp pilus assembly protein PilF